MERPDRKETPPALRAALQALAAAAALAAVTALGRAVDANAPTVGFVYLVVVVAVALRTGLAVALLASLAAAGAYNYFFFPPVGTFAIDEPENWAALATFLLSSVVVTRLVARAERRAREAEERRRQVEALSAERGRFLEERAHLEALKESDALKTSLLRAVSHDLRTPITAIRMGLNGLRRRVADPDARGEVKAVSREVERLSRRIDNLLARARLEAGTVAPNVEPTPPGDLFRAALEQLPLVLEGRTVDASVESDVPDALVDPVLAVEVLVNLLENAARVSPAGAPLALTASAQAGRVRFDVADRGPGMPAPGAAAAEAGSDLGLGLEICRSLAAALGGSVAHLPREGGGTVARFDVPAARMDA